MSPGRTRARPRRRRTGLWIGRLVTIVAVAVIAALGIPIWTALAPGPSDPAPSAVPPVDGSPSYPSSAAALEALAGLGSTSGHSIARYQRESFGQAWYDLDRNDSRW